MNPNEYTPETLTLDQAKQLCLALHRKHEALESQLGAHGQTGGYLISDFADCLRVMKIYSEAIKKCEAEIAKRNGDIATKIAILELAKANLP